MVKKKAKRKTEEKGITLLALTITIIVLIILSAVTYNLTLGENGIITKAYEAKYLTELSQYKEELELFKAEKLLENNNFEGESLTSAYNSLLYNTQPEGETGTIYDVIKSLKGGTFDGKMEIIKGELLLNSQDMTEIRMAQKLDIQVNPYLIVDGVLLSANTNLALMDENGSLTIPESVRAIGEGAFADLSGLKTIIIPGTVKEIRQNAFRNNKDLENVILMEGVESIGDYAFQSCEKIINVDLPESLINIGQRAFIECTNLIEIEIPSKIETINIQTFQRCSSLTTLKLTEGIKQIDYGAFSACSKLDNIYIPKTLEIIDSGAFGGCVNLSNIEVDNENSQYKYESNSGLLMKKDGTDIIFISAKVLNSIDTFEIPEGIINFSVNIGAYSNIRTIIIPNSLETMGEAYIFPYTISNIEVKENNQFFTVENNCLYSIDKKRLIVCFTKEETVQLSNQLEIIGSYAFKAAPNLTELTLPESVTTIKGQILSVSFNSKLKKLNLGKNVSSIDPTFRLNNGNFSDTVTIDEANPYYIIENNVLYSKDKSVLVTPLYRIKGKFIVDSNVKTLGSYSLYYQSEMTEIEIPDGLININSRVFSLCNSLKSIHLPESLQTIEKNAFLDARDLEQIQIDKEPESIEGSPWGAIRGDRIVEWLR